MQYLHLIDVSIIHIDRDGSLYMHYNLPIILSDGYIGCMFICLSQISCIMLLTFVHKYICLFGPLIPTRTRIIAAIQRKAEITDQCQW